MDIDMRGRQVRTTLFFQFAKVLFHCFLNKVVNKAVLQM